MQLKIDDIEIPKSNPFQNCELGRKPYADILESLVCNGKGGCVMSLDGAWGTGKTTFVKMWLSPMRTGALFPASGQSSSISRSRKLPVARRP